MRIIGNMKISLVIMACLASLFLSPSLQAASDEVGSVSYVRGAVTRQSEQDGSNAHLLVRGKKLKAGDVIKTGSKSFAMLKLADGTRLTIRPKTSFVVEEMNARKDSTASAVLRLFRGGLRAITGFISKKNPNGYKLRTSVATIGIRGTEFDARLCGEECAEENSRLIEKKKPPRAVAKVIFTRGSLKAIGFDEETRELKGRASIFEGDTLITGNKSYAVVVFRDKSRVTLQSNTRFRIDEMRFDEKKPEKSSSLFSLLKGGLRAVTGLMGKLNPSGYRMRTAIATIGIRGTGYDLSCSGSCAVDNSVPTDIDLPNGPGLYSSVWDGAISMDGQPVGLNQAAHKGNKQTPPKILKKIPLFFKNNPAPKPGSIKIKQEKLFSERETKEVPPGLYVSVEEGKVEVKPSNGKGVTKKIGAQQAVHVSQDGRAIRTLPAIPVFQQYDNYPKPGKFVDTGLQLGDTLDGDNENKKVCVIK